MISKDELKSWDPDIRSVEVMNDVGKKYLHIQLELNSSVLTFTKEELEKLLKELGD